MSKLALMVTVECEAEERTEVVKALLAHRERCLQEEPGTLQFEVMVPAEDPTKILLLEVYADAAAFETHIKGTSILKYRQDNAGKTVRSTHHKCALAQELDL